jgi:ABC-type polysaccharide/polyol phosphate export permease
METFRNPVTKELWPSYWWLFNLNPFFHLAVSYQEVLFYPGPFGHMSLLLLMAGVSVAVFLGGYWLFDRLRDSFAEAV